ncbi:POK18 protein, partial [Drymodes brunneopygia]|nr:POK18 protein [Drymodes brunneopygia]
RHVERHLYSSYAVLGVPAKLKTDNGPGYRSLRFAQFCNLWGIAHDTSIPHVPTAQAIIEHA